SGAIGRRNRSVGCDARGRRTAGSRGPRETVILNWMGRNGGQLLRNAGWRRRGRFVIGRCCAAFVFTTSAKSEGFAAIVSEKLFDSLFLLSTSSSGWKAKNLEHAVVFDVLVVAHGW